jgi:hypothetical protein
MSNFCEGDMPQKKYTPKIGANIGAITGILLKIAQIFNSFNSNNPS